MVAVPTQPVPVPGLRLVYQREEPEEMLAQYLPGILRQDPFLTQFLRIFDEVLRPIIDTIDSMDAYLDPKLTPAELLPWLSRWVGLLDTLPDPVARGLLTRVAEIHRERGTKDGLKAGIEIVTGAEALVVENTAGLRLDADARLGINTSLAPSEPNAIHVTLISGGSEIDSDAVANAIRELKPAHATYTVRVSEA